VRVRTGGRCDPPPPESFSEPVANLGRAALDVVAELERDAADRVAVDFYRENGLRILPLGESNPLFGILFGVGMREAISQVAPDLVVVGVANQRGLVALLPRANDAAPAVQPHALPFGGTSHRGTLCSVQPFIAPTMPYASFPPQDAVRGSCQLRGAHV
jgi:hypothetical protein